jgi:hypothetical protein
MSGTGSAGTARGALLTAAVTHAKAEDSDVSALGTGKACRPDFVVVNT